MIKDYFSLALGNLRHRGVRSWLTMIGIFIGIAAVVSLISLGQGLQTAVTGQFASIDPDKLVMQNAGTGFGPPGSTSIADLTSHDVRIIENTPGVEEVIPRLIRIVSVEYNKERSFEFVASIPQEQKKIDIVNDAMNVKISQGRLLKAGDRGKVVLGNDFNDDKYGKEIRIGSKINIQGKEFEVVGLLKPAQSFQVNSVILMVEQDVRDLLDIDDEIDLIVIQVEDEKRIEQTSEAIAENIRQDRDEEKGEEDFSIQTPLQSVEAVSTVLNVINYIVIGIAAISLLVGGIGIANTMYTSVLERTKEIGIMKAIGARNLDITSVFIIEAGLMGLVGGIVGAILGVGMSLAVAGIANQFFGETIIAVSISWPLVLGAISFSFVLGILSGIFPAFQASNLKPVEALRK